MPDLTEFTPETGTWSTEQPAEADPRSMRLVARILAPAMRQRLVAAISAGQLRTIDRVAESLAFHFFELLIMPDFVR